MNKQKIKSFLPYILLLAFALAIYLIIFNKPQVKRGAKPQAAQIAVETLRLSAQDYPVILKSYGLVSAQVKTVLSSQVAGKVEYVAESMRSGGFFDKNELLIKIEDVDYQAKVQIAYANLVEAEQNLIEQQALADQAKQDWQRLGSDKTASDLVLRKPQLAAAQAKVESAKANHQQALINLQRTEIRAPYNGRVLIKSVDLGQVIGTNAQVGEIYSTDAIEVSLPIKNNEIRLLNLPENYRGASSADKTKVTLISNLSGEQAWQGEIVRTASEIDPVSRQLHVVARIEDPFGKKAYGKVPLKIGQYVTAQVRGNTLKNVIVIPNKTIYQGQYVYLYQDGTITRRNVEILWQNESEAVIQSGLEEGDLLVTTSLGQVSSGTKVKVKSEQEPKQ
ncbi:efflux RND transporter periplasmic adaptor subunit [Catenovulum sediminis]|uniref:Efflux RND transporter periplasmic adaptor subunit n=1 Tax=Catenovulum sediminis TaxID=1740262 RepID=A0ABV1RLG6_9ALTE|nr:efflux RND transporter periplasmic adaptor subunit [Catenovulum sediminis]